MPATLTDLEIALRAAQEAKQALDDECAAWSREMDRMAALVAEHFIRNGLTLRKGTVYHEDLEELLGWYESQLAAMKAKVACFAERISP